MVTRSLLIAGRVLSISCSRRVLLVAMSTQIMAYDLATMEMSYSAITYPAPNLKQPGDKAPSTAAVPLALGPRWLAHASNQVIGCSAPWLASRGSQGGLSRTVGGSLRALRRLCTRPPAWLWLSR